MTTPGMIGNWVAEGGDSLINFGVGEDDLVDDELAGPTPCKISGLISKLSDLDIHYSESKLLSFHVQRICLTSNNAARSYRHRQIGRRVNLLYDFAGILNL